MAALRAVAIGYVRKDADPQTPLDTIRVAARSRMLLDVSVAGALLQKLSASPRASAPTPR